MGDATASIDPGFSPCASPLVQPEFAVDCVGGQWPIVRLNYDARLGEREPSAKLNAGQLTCSKQKPHEYRAQWQGLPRRR